MSIIKYTYLSQLPKLEHLLTRKYLTKFANNPTDIKIECYVEYTKANGFYLRYFKGDEIFLGHTYKEAARMLHSIDI